MVLLRALLDHLRTVQANRSSAQVQQTLRARLYDRIVSLGPAWFANQRTGGVMLTVVDGVEQLQTFFGQYLPQVAIAAAAPFAIFAVIAFWDVPTALVFLVAALFALFGPMAVHMLDRRASLARTRSLNEFGEEFLDAVQGLPTLKSYGQGKTWGERLAARLGSVRQHLLGAVGQPADARHQRPGRGAGRRAGADGRRLARGRRRHERGGAADRADGRHRDLPPAARPALGAAPGHAGPVGRRQHPCADGRAAADRRPRRAGGRRAGAARSDH
ncbi:ABC transporter transmembrane domain-containing protein [Achromobacter insuavis]